MIKFLRLLTVFVLLGIIIYQYFQICQRNDYIDIQAEVITRNKSQMIGQKEALRIVVDSYYQAVIDAGLNAPNMPQQVIECLVDADVPREGY